MDSGSDNILTNRTLHEFLRERTDGRWAFLAAAAGRSDAVEELSVAVSRTELDRGTAGAALVPSLVSERIEALAVSAGATLVRVAHDWRKPRETGDDPFWAAAWTSALRHLAAQVRLDPNDFRYTAATPEAELLWPIGDRPTYTWNELSTMCLARTMQYEEIRRWSTGLIDDRRVEEGQVAHAPTLLLRVLRSRFNLLTAGALRNLRARCYNRWGQDPFETALLAEALSAEDDTALMTLRRRLVNWIPEVTEALDVIPIAYVLLGQGWVVP